MHILAGYNLNDFTKLDFHHESVLFIKYCFYRYCDFYDANFFHFLSYQVLHQQSVVPKFRT